MLVKATVADLLELREPLLERSLRGRDVACFPLDPALVHRQRPGDDEHAGVPICLSRAGDELASLVEFRPHRAQTSENDPRARESDLAGSLRDEGLYPIDGLVDVYRAEDVRRKESCPDRIGHPPAFEPCPSEACERELARLRRLRAKNTSPGAPGHAPPVERQPVFVAGSLESLADRLSPCDRLLPKDRAGDCGAGAGLHVLGGRSLLEDFESLVGVPRLAECCRELGCQREPTLVAHRKHGGRSPQQADSRVEVGPVERTGSSRGETLRGTSGKSR